MIKQDLHIHTVYSTGDSSVVPEQTVELIAKVGHAEIIGISDHLDYLDDAAFEEYKEKVRFFGLKLGCEVDGAEWADRALELPTDYYIYHCRDEEKEYKGIERLLSRNVPVIAAHPMMMGTKIGKLPQQVYVEINNRYVWRRDWKTFYSPHARTRQFIFGSDAHQPNWLNQTMARFAGEQLGIEETLLWI